MRQLVRLPPRKKTFFGPLYTFLAGFSRAWQSWPGGLNTAPPQNSARADSGQTITQETILTLSAVWGCVFRYSTVISTLPLQLMKTGPKNSATKATDHPLYTILHDRPNELMSASSFWQAIIASMLLWGAGYGRKLFSGSGSSRRLVGVLPLRPEHMTTVLREGRLIYRYAPPGLAITPEEFTADDLFVVLDRTLDGYTGMSRITYARNSFGQALGGEKVVSDHYKNGLRASGVLSISQWLKPEQREAYRSILDRFTGLGSGADTDRQGGVLIAESATKFSPISINPVDVELLASRQFSVEDICRWFDVPPILIGHSSAGQTMWGSGVEQIISGWLKLGLSHILRRIEQEIWAQLLTPAEREGYFAEFNLTALLRGDAAARSQLYSTMAQNGIYTRNEIRAYENLPAVEGGDIITVQSNLVDISKLGEVPESTEDPAAISPDDDKETVDDEDQTP